MDSSLIIITLNRPAILRRTLGALAKQTRAIREIVVVDNGPSAATEEAVACFDGSLPVRYVPEPKRGYGRARNRGLREAHGDILFFLDDDCVAEPGWAEKLWTLLAQGRADLIGGSRLPGRRGLAARLEYLSTDGPVLSAGLKAGPVRHLSTSNLIMSREVADRVGYFDENLTMCEDRDFTTRARKLGFRLWFEPAARVTHYPPIANFSEYLKKMRHYGCGTCEYFEQWRDEEPLGRLFPSSPAARLVCLPALAAAGAAYLMARNLPQHPDAVALSPLLFIGQLWWHWGGFEAMRRCRQTAHVTIG